VCGENALDDSAGEFQPNDRGIFVLPREALQQAGGVIRKLEVPGILIVGVVTQVRIAGEVDTLVQQVFAVIQAQIIQLGKIVRRKFVSEILMGAEWGLAAKCGEGEEI
jgi:hypothetical protein